MPHAITLPLDAEAADWVQRLRRALKEHTGADDALRLGYAPHLTLAVFPGEIFIPAVKEALARAVGDWATLSIMLAGLGVYPGAQAGIWVAPVVTAGLLDRHASLCAVLYAFGIDPHYRPGQWMPHVTLSQRSPSAARAIEVVNSMWDGPIIARLEKIELVEFPHANVLQSLSLQPER